MTNANAQNSSDQPTEVAGKSPSAPSAAGQVAGSPSNLAADDDPLLHLHKMSMTAGLGSGDYVAVNITAVIAVLVGLASLLSFIGSLLLIIPLVGAILAIIALRQIADSNGTQTGKPLALIGLLLSIIITLANFTWRGVDYAKHRADTQAINAVAIQFGNLLKDHDYDRAYDLFDADFQYRVPQAAFKVHLASIQESKMVPPIDSITSNGYVQFQAAQSEAEGTETAEAVFIAHFTGGDEGRMQVWLHKIDGQWKFDSMPDLFPTPKQAQQASQGPGGGAPGQ
jgi:hypothetical protein